MPGVKVDTPPIGVQIVDPKTGMPTRAMADFMHRLWERSGGNDDASDFVLKFLTGSRYQNNQIIESTGASEKDFSRPSETRVGESDKKINQVEQLVYALKPTTFDPERSKKAFDARVPKGGIIAFSGNVADIPKGWFLCDGSNGTPNLTDRFILGAGGSQNPGDTGGDSQYTTNTAGAAAGSDIDAAVDSTIPTMPPWYALALIMKG